jgi:hypothetical protein
MESWTKTGVAERAILGSWIKSEAVSASEVAMQSSTQNMYLYLLVYAPPLLVA